MRKILVALAALAVAAPVHAQLRGVPATLAPLVETSGVHPGTTARAALRVSLPDGFHVQSDKPRDPTLIPTVLTVDPPAGVTVGEIVFPSTIDVKLAGSDQPLAVFEREFAIGVQFAVASGVAPGDLTVPAHLRYQACNDTTCFAPKTADTAWTLKVVPASVSLSKTGGDLFGTIAFGRGEKPSAGGASGATSGAGGATGASGATGAKGAAGAPDAGVAELDNFTVAATTGGYLGSSDFLTFVRNAEAGVKEKGLFEGRGPLAILLIVFLGGLALNLTPCVLPMIPINLAIIGAGSQAGSKGRGFLLGAVYGAAMAVVYGILGVVVILTAGTFGTINSSAWFNFGIAVLFVVLALAMFDIVTIDFSRYSSGIRFGDAGRGTMIVAFGMGAVAALLAGACVAPVVIQVVLFSSNLYAKGTTAALALPFFLGVGMAIPWPIAGAGIASLPRPGAWMVRVKQVFGVIILATAAYYGYEAYSIMSNRWVDASEVASSVQEKLKSGWHASLADGLDAAEREQKPVLIDFWATWCKNCLTMDKTTLENADVSAALANYVKIKFQAEDPDAEPAKSVMKKFDAVGLPTYVILKPKPKA